MIKLVNLSKYYYGNNSVALGLRKVNLEFHTGEFVAITGESGSGKTTLLSTISGMLPYEEGEMYFQGKATSYYDEADWEEYRKNHIAFVFQNYNLIDSYTALENVMTSFLIQGVSKDEAKEKSMQLLERVGIAEFATHRATELSSGQKQRLSIARALAKNTEVIVADEPTGNLDSENGRQIMELFAELSKEKLVITVTHNYEEAAPYVTRKIVIHDGEVEEDIQISDLGKKNVEGAEISVGAEPAQNVELDSHKAEQKKSGHLNTAWTFALMNMKSRLGKSVFLTVFLLVVSAAYFLFMGNFIANLDDTNTKKYENSAFYNSDQTRIIVRHGDGSEMTEEDFVFLQELEHVVYAEKYSLVNDIYYFSEKGVDYQVRYLDDRVSLGDAESYREEVTLDKFSKFMFSSSGLRTSDLAYGSLPESTNDVVIYAEDDSLLGSEIVCYFSNQRDWSRNTYIRMKLSVCGILKEPTNQYYFSEDFCKVLNNGALGYRNVYGFRDYYGLADTFFYIDDSFKLEKEQVVASHEVYGSYMADVAEMNEISSEILELGTVDAKGDKWIGNMHIQQVGAEDLIVVAEHLSSEYFMIISKEAYEELHQGIINTQMGVYVEDYAYLNDVLKAIRGAGYEAVAPFHIGSVEYDDAKVTERLVTLGLSLVAMIVLFVLEIIIVMAFMKNEKSSDLILKSIGMSQKTLTYVKGYTLCSYSVIAFGVMLLLVFTLGAGVSQIKDLLIYYRIYHVLILFVISIGAMLVTTWWYNKYLARFLRAGSEVQV